MLYVLYAWVGLAPAAAASLEDVLASELDRAAGVFAQQPEKPHYIALAVEDRTETQITARSGTIATSNVERARYLDVDLRVGTPELDSTHELRGFSALGADERGQVLLPLDDAPEIALRHVVWRELDGRYRENRERIVMIRADQTVKVEEEDPAPDFEPREPVVDRRPVAPLELDRAAWEKALAGVSATLEASPDVHYANVNLQGSHVVKTFVDTEGTRLVHGGNWLRVSVSAQSTAPDGDVVEFYRALDVHDPGRLPPAETLQRWADDAVAQIAALRKAPRGTPYTGPVILTGRAAGVFFHEVFGHRVEGHRQKREYEGKTFADHVGERILPEFLDIYDDPTIPRWGEVDLNGHYAYDDEGVPAMRAELVTDGVFKGFLMSRSPIPSFVNSNGHGRRMAGMPPVARMGNTIVETSKPVPAAQLRKQLIEEARRQGLPYGIIVEEIDGGFTLTGRVEPNAFNVRASVTRRVYVDGRPDELVRGIDLVGTPLVAFRNVVAAGDDPQVFDGFCGAESGWVPVSAVSPSLLIRNLEFQLKEKGQERPPLLVKPTVTTDGAADAGVR